MPATHFIEAFDRDDRQLLGNLDGQAAITARNPLRTNAWRFVTSPRGQKQTSPRVAYWRLVTYNGREVARAYRIN